MNQFPHFLWQNTLGVTFLITLIVAVRFLFGKRLPARWVWAFWLLLIVRLVTPIVPESRLNIWNLGRELTKRDVPAASLYTAENEVRERHDHWLAAESGRISHVESEVGHPAPGTDSSGGISVLEPVLLQPKIPRQPLRKHTIDGSSIAVIVWAIGFLVMGVVFIGRLITTRRLLRAATPMRHQRTLDLLEECRATMRVRRRISLAELDGLGSPALSGVLKPRILLPAGLVEDLSEEELRHILLHELAHVKRHDFLVQHVGDLATALHWWNPAVWFARHLWVGDRELACDESAVDRIKPPDTPQDYGGTLLRIAASLAPDRSRRTALIAMAARPSEISRRIRRIATARSSKKARAASCASLALLIAIATIGATQEPKQATKANPTEAFTDLKAGEVGLSMAIFRISEQESLRIALEGSDEAVFKRIVEQARSGDRSSQTKLAACFRSTAQVDEKTEVSDMTPISFATEYEFDKRKTKLVAMERSEVQRGVGTHLGFTASPRGDRSRVEVEFSIEHHLDLKPKTGSIRTSATRRDVQHPTQPEFNFLKIETSAALVPGKTSLVQLFTTDSGIFAIFVRAELSTPK